MSYSFGHNPGLWSPFSSFHRTVNSAKDDCVTTMIRKYALPLALTVLLILVLIGSLFVRVPVPSTLEPSPHSDAAHRTTSQPSVVLSATASTPLVLHARTSPPAPTITSAPASTPTPTVTPTLKATPSPTLSLPRIEVIADELTVHRGPGQRFPILYTVRKGDILVVQSKNLGFDKNPWFLIRVRSDETEEWITGDIRYVTRYNVAHLSYRSSACPGAPPQHVQVGDKAVVCTKSDLLRVRREPRLSSSTTARLSPGTYVTILDGPSCANSHSWWKIQTTSGIVGWVAEGGDDIDPYFICPAR